MTAITPAKLASSGAEHGHQKVIMLWAAMNLKRYPMLKWMHAVPNGGARNIVTATNMKAEDVKAGVGYVVLPYACNQRHGLHIQSRN